MHNLEKLLLNVIFRLIIKNIHIYLLYVTHMYLLKLN